ncbi:MAG: flavodoxin domain-containing protein [Bacteroidales bacterium]|nr:flavodoxin domain-containing protein [Bacteroidales bacterium]
MSKIALLYAPKGGSVEQAAKKMENNFPGANINLFEISVLEVSNIQNYDHFIMGCSTVGAENWQDAEADNEWDAFFYELKEKNISLEGKKWLFLDLGNQVLYPDHFVDAMIYLKNKCESLGAKVIGEWPLEGYEFTNSDSVVDGKFVGLPLDEVQRTRKERRAY